MLQRDPMIPSLSIQHWPRDILRVRRYGKTYHISQHTKLQENKVIFKNLVERIFTLGRTFRLSLQLVFTSSPQATHLETEPLNCRTTPPHNHQATQPFTHSTNQFLCWTHPAPILCPIMVQMLHFGQVFPETAIKRTLFNHCHCVLSS